MEAPMIAIICTGSAGDVLPFIPLGQALRLRGANVVIITHPGHKARVEAKGLLFEDVGPDPIEERARRPEGQAIDQAGAWGKAAALKAFMQPLISIWAQKSLDACRAQNVKYMVIPGCSLSTCSVVDALQLPCSIAHLAPFAKTTHHAPPVGYGSGQVWFGWAALLRWRLWEDASFSFFKDTVNTFRVGLGLTSLEESPFRTYWNKGVPHLMGYSKFLCPKPDDVPTFVHITGQWCEPEPEVKEELEEKKPFVSAIPGDVLSFLEQDAVPVIFVVLGSMLDLVCKTEEALNSMLGTIAKAVADEGARALIATRGCEKFKCNLSNSRQLFLTGGFLPHAELMGRCAGVLCQGGSGTLHSALRAGTPVIVVPALPAETDQPFFAAVCQHGGFGVNPGYTSLSQIKSGARLRRAVAEFLRRRSEFTRQAQQIAESIKGEGGVMETADIILTDYHKQAKA